MSTVDESQMAEVVQDVLTQKGFLFQLSIRQWAGRARLTEDDLGLEGLTRSELHRLGQRQLIPKAVLAAIAAIGARARSRLSQVSYDFPIGGGRFVPVTVLASLLADLNRIKSEFIEQVTAFGIHYDEHAEAQRALWRQNATELKSARGLSDQWLEAFEERLVECYPPLDEVKEAFGFTWALFSISLPKNAAAQLVDGEEAIEAARLADEAKRQVEAQIASFVGEAAVELRRRAGELCAHVAKQVRESGEKVSERSLQPLRELIEQFKAMDFTGDRAFGEELEAFRANILGTDAKAGIAQAARESADYRESLAAALDGMATKAVGDSEKAATEALGRFLKFGRAGRAVE